MSIYQWASLITISSAPRFAVRQEGNAPTSAFLTIIASAFIILLNAQILCAPVASWKFDFGAPQEVAVVESGWTSVSADTAYSDERGYGWVDTRELQYRDRGFPDKLRRDFVFSRAPQREFRVRVPNGDYRIMLIAGDSLAADHYLTIIAEGMEVIRDINTRRCEYAEITFDVTVRDGMLNIVFASPQHRNWVVNALALEPLGKRKRLKKPMVRKRRFEDPITALRRKMMVPAKNVSALRVIKPPRWDEPSYPWLEDYMRVLERFPLYAERGWHPVKVGDEQLGYFGDIDHAEMGMRAMGNFILVYALLATDPSYDPKPSGIPREVVLEHALQCLRYMCRTHITGDLVRPTGRKWGNHWQSAWWASKMATGAQLLWDILTAEDKALIERVISYEADRHLKRRAPSGEHRDTKSEENAWDAEVLAWACALFPNHPHAQRWRQKFCEFAMNTLSTKDDASDLTVIDNRPVREWVYTVNIHSDFTIENHGAYHFCYMACPLHSFAFCYWAFIAGRMVNQSQGELAVPRALWHHVNDVWQVMRRTFLFNNRFAYLGGKDWPRYAYGMYFIMPALVMLQYAYEDADARLIERQRFMRFEWEQLYHADGSFYSGRFTRNIMMDRWAEYETDTYAMLALCYLMHRYAATNAPMPTAPHGHLKRFVPPITPPSMRTFQRSIIGTWSSAPSGFIVARGRSAFISFSQRMLRANNLFGLFIPRGCDDIIEWGAEQLIGRVAVKGADLHKRSVELHRGRLYGVTNGFAIVARIRECLKGDHYTVDHRFGMVALPDDGICVLLDWVRAVEPVTVTLNEGLRLHIANDIFNGNERRVYSSAGAFTVKGVEERKGERRVAISSSWVNIDDVLGIARIGNSGSATPFILRDIPSRNAPWGSLLYELLDNPLMTTPKAYESGEAIRDSNFVLVSGTRWETLMTAQRSKILSSTVDGVRIALVRAPMRSAYVILANLSDEPQLLRLKRETVSSIDVRLSQWLKQFDKLTLPPLNIIVWRIVR